MRIVLTRAMADAVRTREALETMGHQVILSPVIETVDRVADWPAGVVDAVLVTSAHAFQGPLIGLLPESRRLMSLYLVGGRTGEAARAAGFLGSMTIAKTAAELADIFRRQSHRPRKVVYLAGRERKPDLETALVAMDQDLEVVEVYKAHEVESLSSDAMEALRQGSVNAILHYSRRSAALFLTAAARAELDISGLTHLCLSNDVAGPLREAACPAIHVAKAPNEADLLALVSAASARTS